MTALNPIIWTGSSLQLLDQRVLPQTEIYIEYRDAGAVASAIKKMVVRGAPAIGITAAYGVVLAVLYTKPNPRSWTTDVELQLNELIAARPTAVNLASAVKKMKLVSALIFEELVQALINEAKSIHQKEIDANIRMSHYGTKLIRKGSSVITHCNTGTLATSGVGTALGVIKQAWKKQKIDRVYVDETRPWLQGSRLTMWECQKESISAKLICEGAAASVFAKEHIDWVIVGADRITADGDVINKIGTYSLAVNAKYHGAKFMVVAPENTVDVSIKKGSEVIIEERDIREVTHFWSGNTPIYRHAAQDIDVYNPAFDVTPANLVDFIVTENGIKKL